VVELAVYCGWRVEYVLVIARGKERLSDSMIMPRHVHGRTR
jgi:hypothetical protein